MKQTSKTGLTASPTKIVYKVNKARNVQLRAVVKPAPYILKPYAGLYNPYATGCSLLCNHPMEKDAKELFRKAKENWTSDDKRNSLLAEEIEAIRANLHQFSCGEKTPRQVESVPEELFRRYTDTDSRPLTPAPTLASAATYASGSRRCITPEGCSRRQKTQLVLDLRRSHSQENIPHSGSQHGTPLVRVQHVPTRAASLEEIGPLLSLAEQSPRKVKTAAGICKINDAGIKFDANETEVRNDIPSNEEDCVKRRGKRRKKKESSRGLPAFQVSTDPETQVAAIGMDSANQSARTSIIPTNTPQEKVNTLSKNVPFVSHKSIDVDSFLDDDILRQFRRELNEEMVDSELNLNRRKALREAFKSISKEKTVCQELLNLQNELRLPKLNTDLWISLPRNFTRSSARFELPMSSSSLSTITPIQYAREYVSVSSERKLLFNCVFNKFKIEATEIERKLPGHLVQDALDLLMGRPMKREEASRFRNLIGWNDQDCMDFRTFCGVAALCERIMAPFYSARLADRKTDPCHEIETADFEMLARKINGIVIDEKLVQILTEIKTL